MKRKGYGLGKGKGYYNMLPMDSHVHSLSAKGVKTKLTYPQFKNKVAQEVKKKKGEIDLVKASYNVYQVNAKKKKTKKFYEICPSCGQQRDVFHQGIDDLQFLCPDCDREDWIKWEKYGKLDAKSISPEFAETMEQLDEIADEMFGKPFKKLTEIQKDAVDDIFRDIQFRLRAKGDAFEEEMKAEWEQEQEADRREAYYDAQYERRIQNVDPVYAIEEEIEYTDAKSDIPKLKKILKKLKEVEKSFKEPDLTKDEQEMLDEVKDTYLRENWEEMLNAKGKSRLIYAQKTIDGTQFKIQDTGINWTLYTKEKGSNKWEKIQSSVDAQFLQQVMLNQREFHSKSPEELRKMTIAREDAMRSMKAKGIKLKKLGKDELYQIDLESKEGDLISSEFATSNTEATREIKNLQKNKDGDDKIIIMLVDKETGGLKAKGKKKLTKEQKLKRGLGTVVGMVAGAEATKGTGYGGVGALVGSYAGYKFAESLDGKSKSEIVKKDIVDVKGFTIPKGTRVFIQKKSEIKNPMTGKTEIWRVVKIDNGTGHLDLMPETAYKEIKMKAKGFKKPRGSIRLAVQQAVTVPSTEFNKKIPKKEFEKRVDDVQKWLSKTYGGETSIQGQGGYISDTGKLIEEPVVVVTSFADTSTFNKKTDSMVDKLNTWKKKWKQETIAYQVEDDLFLI